MIINRSATQININGLPRRLPITSVKSLPFLSFLICHCTVYYNRWVEGPVLGTEPGLQNSWGPGYGHDAVRPYSGGTRSI
jgi:hypothetical protein